MNFIYWNQGRNKEINVKKVHLFFAFISSLRSYEIHTFIIVIIHISWFPMQFFMVVHIYLHMTPLRHPALTRFYLACTLMTLSTHLSSHLSMATFGKVHEA